MGLITFPVVGGVKNGDGLSLGEGILRSGLKNSECNDDKGEKLFLKLYFIHVEMSSRMPTKSLEMNEK